MLDLNIAIRGDHSVHDAFRGLIVGEFVEAGIPLHEGTANINKADWDSSDIQSILTIYGAKQIFTRQGVDQPGGASSAQHLCYRIDVANGYIGVSISDLYDDDGKKNGQSANLSIMTNSYQTTKDLVETFSKYWKDSTENEGKVWVVTTSQGGYALRTLGMAGIDFIESNYNESVVEDYKYIVSQLGQEVPNGRIVIMDGEPGVGKTTAVRSLINSIPNSSFIIIPSNLVDSISDPAFIDMFLRYKDSLVGPMIVILEDADRVLVSRGSDNISAISTLLNTTDGIIGHMLDIRIVATTNKKSEEVDAAILRPGRLLKQMSVGELTPERASAAFLQITGIVKTYTSPQSLAQVYFDSKTHEKPVAKITNKPKKRRSMGFGAEPEDFENY